MQPDGFQTKSRRVIHENRPWRRIAPPISQHEPVRFIEAEQAAPESTLPGETLT